MLSKVYVVLRLLQIPYKEIDAILPKTGVILDLGCGNGPLAAYLANSSKKRTISGWDIDDKRLSDARAATKKLKNLTFALKDPGKERIAKVDAVLASDFLHHVPFSYQEKIIKNISNGLNKQGTLVIKEVDKDDTVRFLGSFFFDHLFYLFDRIYFRSEKDWIRLLELNGFTVTVKKTLSWFPASTKLFICKLQ